MRYCNIPIPTPYGTRMLNLPICEMQDYMNICIQTTQGDLVIEATNDKELIERINIYVEKHWFAIFSYLEYWSLRKAADNRKALALNHL